MRYAPTLTALLVLALAGHAAAHPPGRTTTDKYLLFVSDRQHGHKHVFRMDLDGSHVIQLTGGTAEDAAPSYLPDGQILYASNRSGKWQVYRMRPDGTGSSALTGGADAGNNFSPAAAPDGSIVFVSDRTNEVKQIFLLRPNSMEAKQLTMSDQGDSNTSPVITPDMRIVFTGERAKQHALWQMNMDGTDARPFPIKKFGFVDSPAVIPSTVRDPLAAWPPSPGSGLMEMPRTPQHRLVYSIANDTEGGWLTHVYRMLFSGDDFMSLTDSGHYNGNPVVLKDGRIAYTSDRSGALDIWVMDMNGNSQVNLTKQLGHYNSTK